MLSQLILWEPLQAFSVSLTQLHAVVATLAQCGVLPGVAIKAHSDDTSSPSARATKKQKVQAPKPQLFIEAKPVLAKLESEG